jgi:hypothetical protein
MSQRIRLKKETIRFGNKDVPTSVKAIKAKQNQAKIYAALQKSITEAKSLQKQFEIDKTLLKL